MPQKDPKAEAEAQAAKLKEDFEATEQKAEEEAQKAEQEKQILQTTVSDLEKQVAELKQMFGQVTQNTQSQPQVTHKGMVGSMEKFKLDPSYYPSPVERLSNEPKLQRFAFKENYELTFEVKSSSYQTIDGVNVKEPKFNLELRRVIFDEDGNKTNGRYLLCTATFHEDPEAAIIVANQNGLPVDEQNEKKFLDEMRYLRIRDWLLDTFYPPKPSQEKKSRKQMVVGGKVVDYFEVNSEEREPLPFDQLKTQG